jgi:hypothetical protein
VGMKMVQKLEAQVDALCKERAQLERDKKGLENANVMLNRQLQVSHAAQLSKNQLCQIQHAELMSLRPQSGGGGQQTMQFNGTPYGQPQTTTTMQHQHFVRDHLSLALSNSLFAFATASLIAHSPALLQMPPSNGAVAPEYQAPNGIDPFNAMGGTPHTTQSDTPGTGMTSPKPQRAGTGHGATGL